MRCHWHYNTWHNKKFKKKFESTYVTVAGTWMLFCVRGALCTTNTKLAPLDMKMTHLHHFEASYLFDLKNIKTQIVAMTLMVSVGMYRTYSTPGACPMHWHWKSRFIKTTLIRVSIESLQGPMSACVYQQATHVICHRHRARRQFMLIKEK